MAFDVLFLIGRVLVGTFYIMNGINHFTKSRTMAGYAKSKKVPFPEFFVFLTGLMLILGGASLLLGYYPILGIALIVVFLVITSLFMHNFWAVPQEQRMSEMINFMKNIALAGSTLMFLAIQAPWAFSI